MSEKKYKQTEIPTITITDKKDLVKAVKDYYTENIQGKIVVNKALGIPIHFASDGKWELAYGRRLYAKKVAILKCLPELVEIAEYNNFGQRKETDKKSVIGYLNFKAKVKMNDKIEHVRISIVFKTNGKYYYNHEVNTKK